MRKKINKLQINGYIRNKEETMNNTVKTYYIPTNPNIFQGHIYTLYLNNNTNLDLTNIIPLPSSAKNIVPTPPPSIIPISIADYDKLLELNNRALQLSTQRTMAIEAFIKKETDTTQALSTIQQERQELIKKLSKGSVSTHER